MTASFDGDAIRLSGDCAAEDAETLVSLLLANPQAVVELSDCGRMHTAVFQALLALRPRLAGEPADDFAREWLYPLLKDSLPDGARAP